MQGTFGVNPLILVLCDTAASYLSRQGMVGAEERVTLRQGGSGGSGLDMSVEDDLSTQLMALFGADELHQLPTELGEAMTELSALQERGVAWSRGDSLVWLVPGALRSWVAMHSPGAGDDVVSQRSGAAPSIPESESVRSSVISRGWYQVPLRESVAAAEHYRPPRSGVALGGVRDERPGEVGARRFPVVRRPGSRDRPRAEEIIGVAHLRQGALEPHAVG